MTSKPAERPAAAGSPLSNWQIAECFLAIAELLEAQGANAFRVRAYRNAAEMLEKLNRPIRDILTAEGLPGLTCLPGIGQSLARATEQLAVTGRLGLLERLRGAGLPETLFASVPGIGREMAARIHERLDIETLAELEAAAYDGRLAQVPGMGRRRVQAVRESLAGRFRRHPYVPVADVQQTKTDQPSVEELLDVDNEYRSKAKAGKLSRIAPKRFNPTRSAWLPALHTSRGSRHYTALFSNTARAHEMGTTDDWVVIYRDDHKGDGQWTVVTCRLGKLRGLRLVRGREAECQKHYSTQATEATNT